MQVRGEIDRLGGAIHEMGTTRMGHDPAMSVLNGYAQSDDVPNLFVTDGSAMTSSGTQNPSLTYMASTARAGDYAVSAHTGRLDLALLTVVARRNRPALAPPHKDGA